MMKKRLSKKIWYGSEVDNEGNPIVPELAKDSEDLEGIHHGELYLHEADDKLSLWTRTLTNQVKPIGGLGGGGDLWKLMETETGEKYLFTEMNVVTQMGLTSFASVEDLDLPSIYDGLVIDNQTIVWEVVDGVKTLVAKGGGSGSGTIKDVVVNVEGNANAITNVELSADKTGLVFTKGLEFAGKKYVDDTLKGYLPLTGGTMLGSIDMSVGSVIKWGDNASLIGQNENLYITSKKQLFIATGKTGNTISPKAAIAANGNMGIAGSLLVGQAGYSTSHTLYVKGNSLFEGSISSDSVYPRIDNFFSLGSENLRFNNAYIQNICIGKTEINEYQEGVLRIEGNLLVTGGITAFADQYSSTSIMDALVCDEQTITVEEVDGVKTLKVICETGNSIDEEALKGIIDGYGFLTEVKAKDSYLGKNDMAASASKAKFDFDNNEISTTYLKVVDAERRFVTTDTEQIIEVKKNFKGGLFVNGGEIKYNGSYWQLDGDLLVTGGITAFADRYSSTSIMDAIVCDERTITAEGGILKVIGGGSSGGVDKEAVKEIIEKYNYLTLDKLPTATTSAKGIASFDSNSFNVSSGHVTFNGGKVKVVTSTPSTYESNTLYVIVG